MKATMPDTWEPIPSDWIDTALEDLTAQLHDNPDYHVMVALARTHCHRLEHRWINDGVQGDGNLKFTLQIRDGGPAAPND
ncbi:MAG: hypothetical protein NVSMB52_03530 [Chloroflexota bacterium]